MGPKKYEEKGKTVELMCRMVEPIKSSGTCVTMDSDFAVLQGIVEMERVMGVYGQSLVKKRGRYWPKGVPGDMIDTYFQEKPIGYSESFETTFDNHPFFVHCTKGLLYFLEIVLQPVARIFFLSLYAEEKYVTKIMSSFGCLNPVQDHQAFRMLSDRTIARWPYAEPNSCHNKSKHWVDDANNWRHLPIDLSYLRLTK